MDVGWVVDSVRMRPTATRIVNSSSTAITANTTVVLYRGAVPSVCVRGPSCKPVCGRICQVMAMARHLVPIERSSTQTENTNLSATTLSTAQLAVHAHEQGTWTWVTSKNMNSGKYNVTYQSGGNANVYNDARGIQGVWSYNTGSGGSHNHGVSNPSHKHTASCTSIKMMPPAKAVHYIMRLS